MRWWGRHQPSSPTAQLGIGWQGPSMGINLNEVFNLLCSIEAAPSGLLFPRWLHNFANNLCGLLDRGVARGRHCAAPHNATDPPSRRFRLTCQRLNCYAKTIPVPPRTREHSIRKGAMVQPLGHAIRGNFPHFLCIVIQDFPRLFPTFPTSPSRSSCQRPKTGEQ